ncbi:MAG: flagellar hook protein FlgE [Desulfuromonadia bacterium]
MSVTSAMFTGISGLSANGEAISVLGNNIANVNTVGFKQGRMLFSDVLSSTITNGQVGRGVQIQSAENIFSQGAFETTDSATDLAIQGDPFFVLSDNGQRFYTRAGAFHFNVDDVLVNPDGYHVLGYGIDQTTGQSNGVLGDIDLTTFSSIPPKATTDITLVANLDAGATPIPPATTFDPDNPATYSASTSMTVYDSLGNAIVATHYYRKTPNPNEWEIYQRVGTTVSPTPATVTFNVNGALATINGNPVPPSTLTLNGYTIDIDGTTQYASPSIVTAQTQNGYAAGSKVKTTIDSQGFVRVVYSNGQTQSVAQIALARFQSPYGLTKAGNTLFEETISSGPANLVVASTPGVGKIFSNSLEQSNVDLAAQFVKLIQAQRAFSANSKTITTADEMTQEVLNLKR